MPVVPIVKTSSGALVSGAPQEHSPIPVGKPDATGRMVEGLRSEDGGASCERTRSRTSRSRTTFVFVVDWGCWAIFLQGRRCTS